jgi:hypothetical protein
MKIIATLLNQFSRKAAPSQADIFDQRLVRNRSDHLRIGTGSYVQSCDLMPRCSQFGGKKAAEPARRACQKDAHDGSADTVRRTLRQGRQTM